jgi:hypothetical protein
MEAHIKLAETSMTRGMPEALKICIVVPPASRAVAPKEPVIDIA